MANTIDNFDDVIDSRDVIARIAELEGEREALQTDIDTAHEEFTEAESLDSTPEFLVPLNQAIGHARTALAEWDADDGKELAILKALADEASGYAADWQHGETLIRDSYFKDYAQELADDIGAIDNNASWPLTCIDWDQAARELRMDYSAVDFDGVTYWIR